MKEQEAPSPGPPEKLVKSGEYYAQETHIPDVRVRTTSPYGIEIPENAVEALYLLGKKHEKEKGIIHRSSFRQMKNKHELRELADKYPLLRGIESKREGENFYLNIYPTRQWNVKLLSRLMGTRFFSIVSGDALFTIHYPIGSFKSKEEMEMKKRKIIDFLIENEGVSPEDAENMVFYNFDVTVDPNRFSKVLRQLRGRIRLPRRVRVIKSRTISSESLIKGKPTLTEKTKGPF